MTGVIETAAVTTAISTAVTTLGLAGYGHARGHARLLGEAVTNAEGGPLTQSPVANVSERSVKKGPLKTSGVSFSVNHGPPEMVSAEFNGEILHVTKSDGVVTPAMALGGTSVTLEGSKVTAMSREQVPPVLSLTFTNQAEAAKWAKEMQEASCTSAHHTRIQELINHVLALEKHIKDLRARAKKVCELEKANKKLERELKEQKEEGGDEKSKKKESCGNSPGSETPLPDPVEQYEQEIALGNNPVEAAKEKLAQSAATVKKLTEELTILKAAAASAGGGGAASLEEKLMIAERLKAAEAKKNEVETLAAQVTERLEMLTPRTFATSADRDASPNPKRSELEVWTLKLQQRLEGVNTSLSSSSRDTREMKKQLQGMRVRESQQEIGKGVKGAEGRGRR
jgi:hypothetical protein